MGYGACSVRVRVRVAVGRWLLAVACKDERTLLICVYVHICSENRGEAWPAPPLALVATGPFLPAAYRVTELFTK